MDQTPVAEPAVTKPRRRWVGSVVALLALAMLGALAWYLTHRPAASGATGGFGGRGGSAASRGAPASTVGTAKARHADIPVIIEALGTVTSRANVTVTPQVSGVITGILYEEGQRVRKGELLVTIDPQPYQAVLAQVTGALARDTAQRDAARQQLQRYQVLLKQDSIAGQTVDTQAALVQQLAGTVAVDEAAVSSARLNLQWTRIVAPVAGRVGLRPIDAGNYIAAGNATGVATITQLEPIDVAFAIPQERVPTVQQRVASGAALPVTVWDSSRTQQLDAGSFLTMDNQIDVQTGTIKAKARFANKAGLLFPNQFVNVRLLLRTIDAAVVIPVTALRHGPNGDFVYIVNADQTVALREVTAGLSGVDDVAITRGLAVGEQVVTEGGDRLKDGGRVRTGTRPPAAGASAAGASAAVGAAAERLPAAARAPASATESAAAAVPVPGAAVAPPTAAQRQRMLDAVKDNPERLDRLRKLLEAIDRGDPEALQRWQRLAARAR